MSLEFESELVKDGGGRIKYQVFNPGGREHYNLRIWLDGPAAELQRVASVQYELHPTFKEPVRTSSSAAENFAISIWTWGMFPVKATLYFADGTKEERQFYLSYDLPADDGAYVSVGLSL